MTDPQTGQEKPPTPEKKVAVDKTDPDEDIPHPTFELYRHTLLRGANLGGFLSLVLGPPVLFFRGVRRPSEMLSRLGGVCAKGVVSCSRCTCSMRVMSDANIHVGRCMWCYVCKLCTPLNCSETGLPLFVAAP